jgi:hypothetical protein
MTCPFAKSQARVGSSSNVSSRNGGALNNVCCTRALFISSCVFQHSCMEGTGDNPLLPPTCPLAWGDCRNLGSRWDTAIRTLREMHDRIRAVTSITTLTNTK